MFRRKHDYNRSPGLARHQQVNEPKNYWTNIGLLGMLVAVTGASALNGLWQLATFQIARSEALEFCIGLTFISCFGFWIVTRYRALLLRDYAWKLKKQGTPLPCGGCGYDRLYTASDTNACPECGRAWARSVLDYAKQQT